LVPAVTDSPQPIAAPRPTGALRQLAASSQGDAAVEYVVLIGTIAIPVLPALIALGVWLIGLFENMRNLAVMPIP
jgi:Flp pilus assembly pilin Flp